MNLDGEFKTFWGLYPRRTGKLAAEKAYRKARTLASAQQIVDGVDTYRQTKPAYADWCHPATWLNQGRWLDEPDRAPSTAWTCPHQPACECRWRCQQKTDIEAFKRAELDKARVPRVGSGG